MKILLPFFLILIFSSRTLHAQHEADHWYFGKKAGITFSGGTATAAADGELLTLEGCTAISDPKTGALLFYTDGRTVWNSKHAVMQNGTGLSGGYSATQSALIVPNPANILQYYVFTVSEAESTDSILAYSLVSLETPDGTVLTKNTVLQSGVSEKLTGTKDCSGKGYWVVTHARQSGTLYSFHVTKAGVEAIPVVSTYSPDISNFTGGYMKISPNRSKLALASTETGGFLALFDFDPSTGRCSKFMKVNAPLQGNSFYGLSFSPDDSKLYASAIGVISFLYQYEVSVPDSLTIRSSLTILKAGAFVGALQLGPDGKIYTTQNGGGYLGVITKPNLKGTACDYRTDAILLSAQCYLGLPNFMEYIFYTPSSTPTPFAYCLRPTAFTTPDTGCVATPLTFIDQSSSAPTSRLWTFENGTPASSTDSMVTVTYTTPGVHRVVLVVQNDNGSDSILTQAVVFPYPTANAGSDRTSCARNPTQLGSTRDSLLIYSWQPVTDLDDPTNATPIATPKQSMTYILTVTNAGGCSASDTIHLTLDSITPTITTNTAICRGESLQLLAAGGDTYQWSPVTGLDNPTVPNPTATPVVTTTYTALISRNTCIDSATVTIEVKDTPLADAGNSRSICAGESTILGQPPVAGNTYRWTPTRGLRSPTASQTDASPDVTTTYILAVSNSVGCTSYDTLELTVTPANLLAFTLSPDTISFMPGQQCTARIHIPKFTSDWHLRLNYDPRIITFTNIYQTTGGISMRAPRAIKDTLFLSGTGDDGEMRLDFRTFLPYSTDTIFPMHLSIDTANATNCDSMVTLPSGGIVLSLGGICGKGFRAAEETGKSYFLISKAHTVEFGVGLAGHVRLDVFDDLGSLIQTPLDTYLPAGAYSSTIDLPTGVYFWRIRAGMYQQVVPMVVVR